MPYERFEKLAVWQRSIEMVESVYRLTRSFPADEKSGLAASLRRTAAAIPARIAEGDGQDDPAKASAAFTATRSSIREMQTYTVICRRLGFLSYFKYSSLRRQLRRIDRALETTIELLEDEQTQAKPAPRLAA